MLGINPMSIDTKFEFSRARGVVWVCDISGSSKVINDEKDVNGMEEFIPRLYWLSMKVVEITGGRFIKWTGDGFLAWYPFELHRDLGVIAERIITAAWHISVMVNVTQMGVRMGKKLNLRHGLSVEHDALIMKITGKGTNIQDIMGRSVVLAFRLSGIDGKFPNIVAQSEIVDAYHYSGFSTVHFNKRKFNLSEVNRYFKGEKWATTSIYETREKTSKRKVKVDHLITAGKNAIASAEGQSVDSGTPKSSFDTNALVNDMQSGPKWANEVLMEYARWITKDLLGSLKTVVASLETQLTDKKNA